MFESVNTHTHGQTPARLPSYKFSFFVSLLLKRAENRFRSSDCFPNNSLGRTRVNFRTWSEYNKRLSRVRYALVLLGITIFIKQSAAYP